jgi:hypothetical protein
VANEHDLANEVLVPLMADLLGRHVNTVRATYGRLPRLRSAKFADAHEIVLRGSRTRLADVRVGPPLAARTELTDQMLIFGEQSWRNPRRIARVGRRRRPQSPGRHGYRQVDEEAAHPPRSRLKS